MSTVYSEQKENNLAVELLVPFLIYKYVLGEAPSNENIIYRILWQKVGYFAKKLGLPLHHYDFSWYKRGPYSSGYTSVLYKICDEPDNLLQHSVNFELNQGAQDSLQPLINCLSFKPNDIQMVYWMELLASIDYLSSFNQGDKKKTLVQLTKLKPIFNDEYVKDLAWNVLENEGMM